MKRQMTGSRWAVLQLYLAGVDAGFVPTIRDVARALGWSSTQAVSCHLRRLLEDGYLEQPGLGRRKARRGRMSPARAVRPGENSARTLWGWVPCGAADYFGGGGVESLPESGIMSAPGGE